MLPIILSSIGIGRYAYIHVCITVHLAWLPTKRRIMSIHPMQRLHLALARIPLIGDVVGELPRCLALRWLANTCTNSCGSYLCNEYADIYELSLALYMYEYNVYIHERNIYHIVNNAMLLGHLHCMEVYVMVCILYLS